MGKPTPLGPEVLCKGDTHREVVSSPTRPRVCTHRRTPGKGTVISPERFKVSSFSQDHRGPAFFPLHRNHATINKKSALRRLVASRYRSQRGSCALKLSASSDNLLVQETEEQGVLLCKRGSLLLPFPLITEGREQERVEENEKDHSRRQKMSDTDPPLGSRNCPRASCVPAAGRREAQRRSGQGRPWSCPVLTTSFLPPLPSGSPGKNGPESAPRLGEVPLCVLGRLEADAVTMTKRDSCGQCCDGSRLRAAGPLDPGAAPRALPRWTARVWTFFLIRILNTTHFTNNKKILTAFMIIRHLVKFQ